MYNAQDEIFGLPFLFTGGLPNSLEKFTEGNLRCFLIYLIEVVGKANRQNVWLKPSWWKSSRIPYSPIVVDTSRVPQEQVVKELRSLIESCYKFYNAEKILEVSQQLAEIPRILLGIRDNGNNTMTVYDANSKAIYVTVRPENLTYDEKSLNKISKRWKDNYRQEDITFCEIKKTSKEDHKEATSSAAIIEVIDSDEESDAFSKNIFKVESPSKNISYDSFYQRDSSHHSVKKKSSRGVVVKSDSGFIISLSDSEEEDQVKRAPIRLSKCLLEDQQTKKKVKEEDVEFVCEYSPSKPCPKSFKKPMQPSSCPSVIILSDSDEDNDDNGVYISSYTSLAKNYGSIQFFPETSNKNIQKSILGPLLHSPRKGVAPSSVPQRVSSLPTVTNSVSPHKNKTAVTVLQVDSSSNDSGEEDFLQPTLEELHLSKKKIRTFYPSSPPAKKKKIVEHIDFTVKTQDEFMALLGMDNKSLKSTLRASRLANSMANPPIKRNFLSLLRSMRGSTSRMPLDWIRLLSSNKNVIVSKRSSRKQSDPTQINYEQLCSTDKTLVEYSIRTSQANALKEEKLDKRLLCRRVYTPGGEKGAWTVEKWCLHSEEGSLRSKRAALRMLRSLCQGDSRSDRILMIGTLAPTLQRLPLAIFEKALRMPVHLNDTF